MNIIQTSLPLIDKILISEENHLNFLIESRNNLNNPPVEIDSMIKRSKSNIIYYKNKLIEHKKSNI